MKGLIIKVFAVMLLGWYLMGVIGFGIHTCSGSGKTFIVSFIESPECADIHPEHHCEHHSCCEHHHEDSKDEDCCSNKYQALDLTGTVSQEDSQSGHFSPADWFHSPAVMHIASAEHVFPKDLRIIKYIHEPDSGHILPGDVQSVLGIWRI